MKFTIWTEEAVERLKALLPLEITFSEVSAKMGGPPFTRRACIGKADRMGLSNGRPRGVTEYSGLPKKVREARKAVVLPPVAPPPPAPPKPKPEPEVFVPLATIETVTDALCKFPLGDATAQMPVCGRPRLPPYRYCEPHHHISRNQRA